MSSISSTLSGFFQLSGQSTTSNSSSSGSGTVTSLAEALAQTDSASSGNNSGSSFLLDLSPDAQKYLQNLSSGSGSNASANGFLLTSAQKQQISDILAKYKDAPYTQATYESIQNDLKAAGLSPQQLSLQDQIRQFNPVSVLVDALSGKSSGSPMDLGSSPDENANANAYMQGIVDQWKSTSTTANDSTAGGEVDPASGTASS